MGPARDPRRGSRSALSPSHPGSPWSRLLAVVARWLRPPRTLRPTRAGWIFFALTFGVGFGALNTGNNLLYLVLSLMLAFLVLSGILSEAALRGISVERRLPDELFAEAAHRVHLLVRNEQRRVPAFAIAVEDECFCTGGPGAPLRHTGRVFVLHLEAGAAEHRHYRLRPRRRGPLRFHGFRVSTRFPFGLFLKSRTLEAPDEALVYPAIEPVPVPALTGARDDEGEARPSPRAVGAAVSGLRDWARGDSLRRVHWRRSLRRGALVVREVEDERSAQRMVTLSAGGATPERFERRVRRAASEVVASLGAGLRVGLRTDESALPAGAGRRHRARLLAALARAELRPEDAA